jgi:putative addiction module killer protein
MIIEKTDIYEKWFKNLKDELSKAVIVRRLRKLELENYFGDCKPVGNKIFELRVFAGQAYRIYFYQKNDIVILLTNGGDKSSQQRDIKRAQQILKKLEL